MHCPPCVATEQANPTAVGGRLDRGGGAALRFLGLALPTEMQPAGQVFGATVKTSRCAVAPPHTHTPPSAALWGSCTPARCGEPWCATFVAPCSHSSTSGPGAAVLQPLPKWRKESSQLFSLRPKPPFTFLTPNPHGAPLPSHLPILPFPLSLVALNVAFAAMLRGLGDKLGDAIAKA